MPTCCKKQVVCAIQGAWRGDIRRSDRMQHTCRQQQAVFHSWLIFVVIFSMLMRWPNLTRFSLGPNGKEQLGVAHRANTRLSKAKGEKPYVTKTR